MAFGFWVRRWLVGAQNFAPLRNAEVFDGVNLILASRG